MYFLLDLLYLKKYNMIKSHRKKVLPLNTIDLNEAVGRIQNWRGYVGSEFKTKAFFIGLDDLQGLVEVLKENSGMGIRCYLGRTGAGQDDLILVGVKRDPLFPNGKDIIEENGPGTIYDLTSPCPNMCDLSSPLNVISGIKIKKPLKDLTAEKNTKGIRAGQTKNKKVAS
jgi:hypothetical protein